MKRRNFLELSAIAGIGLSMPFASILQSCSTEHEHFVEFKQLIYNLLKDWCDGMINTQIIDPSDLKIHGALDCPSCSHIHGRCMDAVYPFLYMADNTGDDKYLKAAILVMEWAENNVSQPDGSWTVIPNPKSWKGITIFGAIALAEALHYHSNVLDEKTCREWTDRLRQAGEYIFNTFTISFTNINYGATAIYGLNLIGRVVDEEKFIGKSKELADGVKAYFTPTNNLLFGEIKPSSQKISAKGLHGVDLGYNVEESLNSLVMYALIEKDEGLLQLLIKSLNSHLEFMLPDGAWDNSWGTRQYKWSYWGSRTCDGSQPAYGMMAKYNPAFGTAAIMNTELLQRCTADGLLHGGPHYVSHGIKPCVHHTFAHAKPLAAMLDHWDHLPEINKSTPLPRTIADGIKHYEDLDTFLFARGDWRGTVTTNDAEYYDKNDYRQATGGALSVLYHNKVGILCAASMAIYKMVEEYNQQEAPGEDIALTPRIETYKDNVWYTNLFDLSASINSMDKDGEIEFVANAQLKNEARELVPNTASDFKLIYNCSESKMLIKVKTEQVINENTAFVLPVISPTGEKIYQPTPNEITIQKAEALVKITANVPLKIMEMPSSRTFNMVPGVEAIPVMAFFKEEQQLVIEIEVV